MLKGPSCVSFIFPASRLPFCRKDACRSRSARSSLVHAPVAWPEVGDQATNGTDARIRARLREDHAGLRGLERPLANLACGSARGRPWRCRSALSFDGAISVAEAKHPVNAGSEALEAIRWPTAALRRLGYIYSRKNSRELLSGRPCAARPYLCIASLPYFAVATDAPGVGISGRRVDSALVSLPRHATATMNANGLIGGRRGTRPKASICRRAHRSRAFGCDSDTAGRFHAFAG